MKKRIKSFLIHTVSIVGTALVAVTFTPEWSTVVKDGYAYLEHTGLPPFVVLAISLIVAEIWKAILNKRIAAKNGPYLGSRVSADFY